MCEYKILWILFFQALYRIVDFGPVRCMQNITPFPFFSMFDVYMKAFVCVCSNKIVKKKQILI